MSILLKMPQPSQGNTTLQSHYDCIITDKMISHEYTADKCIHVKDFATGSGSSTLWRHLAGEHINLWISIWEQKGINITTKLVADKIEAYCTSHGESFDLGLGSCSTWQRYSREAFVDAILAWIVTDEQVDLICLWCF